MDERFLSLSVTAWIALVTFGLLGVAIVQACIYGAMDKANKAIERAYVTMSHNRPGLMISGWAQESTSGMTQGDGVRRQNIKVNVKVTNDGNTPAIVTCHLLHLFISDQPLPAAPPYEPRYVAVVRVFLVKGDSFNIFGNFPVESTAVEQIRHGHELKLYLIGYVDYIDKFGQRHRAGYARIYNPAEDAVAALVELGNQGHRKRSAARNNLPFVTQPGYNYDRKRKEGQGNDWNDPE